MTKKAESLVKDAYHFEDLVEILAFFRSAEGCPWDRAQTHGSIRKNLIEECYEAVEGIDRNDAPLLCEELGDILLQVVFHARIAEEEGCFTVGDVINGICRKMVNRHPQIFSENSEKPKSAQTALDGWEKIKEKEKGTASVYELLERISKTLPSLMRTQKLLQKAEKAGFDRHTFEACMISDGNIAEMAKTIGTADVTSRENMPDEVGAAGIAGRTDTARGAGVPAKKGTAGVNGLLQRYFELCADANALGVDLEELAYSGNENFILAMKKKEKEHEN